MADLPGPTDPDVLECKRLHASGKSLGMIARQFGKSHGWVRRRIRGEGDARKVVACTAAEVAEIRHLRGLGYTPSEIGACVHRSAVTVRKVLGVTKRAVGSDPKTWARDWPKVETTHARALNGRRYDDYRMRDVPGTRPVNGERAVREMAHHVG